MSLRNLFTVQNSPKHIFLQTTVVTDALAVTVFAFTHRASADDRDNTTISDDARNMLVQGRNTFRFDTFGILWRRPAVA